MSESISQQSNNEGYSFKLEPSVKKSSFFSSGSISRLQVITNKTGTDVKIADCAAKKLSDSQEAMAPNADEIQRLNQAKKKSSESSFLPLIFKRTFLVKIDGSYYDINANSLEKNFGITKQQLNFQGNRDITDLLKTSAQDKQIAEKMGITFKVFNELEKEQKSCYRALYESGRNLDFEKNGLTSIKDFLIKVEKHLRLSNNDLLQMTNTSQKKAIKDYLLTLPPPFRPRLPPLLKPSPLHL